MEAVKGSKVESTQSNDSSTRFGLNVSIDSLEKLTGFPKEFIKSELSLSHDEVSMEVLRKSVLSFLNQTLGEVKNLS